MKNYLFEIIHYLPFIGMVVPGGKEKSPLLTRLLEAGIIGGIIMYGVQNAQTEKMKAQSEKIDMVVQMIYEVKTQSEKMSDDIVNLRIEVEKLKADNK